MTDSKLPDTIEEARVEQPRPVPRGIVLAAVCVAVVAGYAYSARLGGSEWSTLNPAEAYYNLLIQGFRAGHLSLNKQVPPEFARLPDPYDPVANQPYRILPYNLSDLSYYKGSFYLYFGVTPALLMHWPFAILTGCYLFDRRAVLISCAIGFLASIGLLRGLWRRYFPDANVGVLIACALALGLANGVPTLLPQSDIYQVAISCGYMLTMLTLGALWCALHEPKRKCRWLAAASLAYGLAVGARPSLLFGAVILLVPVIQTWRERRKLWTPVLAALGPISLVGLGLMLYNFLRFDSPFEFGARYELAAQRQLAQQFFSPRYLWFNFRVYFLAPARWSAPFPFVHTISVPPTPAGYYRVSDPFGILTNIPLVWLALAAPLAWRHRPRQAASGLNGFVTAATLLFAACAITVALFWSAAIRYEADFLPALVLLAVVGILGVERALADQPNRQRVLRWGWGVLLGFSVVFNLLVTAANWSYAGCALGTVLADAGRLPEGIRVLESALRIKPDYADGQQELGHVLLLNGQPQQAIQHSEQAVRLDPDSVLAHNDLALALVQTDRLPEAIEHWNQALRIRPDDVDMHINLGNALLQAGRLQDALGHYQQAVRLKPDSAEAQYNLGNALERAGNLTEAIDHYQQALRINPDFVQAQTALARARSSN